MLDGFQYPYQLLCWREQDVGLIPESVITDALRYGLKAPNQGQFLNDQAVWIPHRDTNITMSDYTSWAKDTFISNSYTNASIHRCQQAIVFGTTDDIVWYNKADVWNWIRNNAQNALLQVYRCAQYLQNLGYCTGFNGKIIERHAEFAQQFPHVNMKPIITLYLGVSGVITHKDTQKANIEAASYNDTDSYFDGPLGGDVTPDMGNVYEWDSVNKAPGASIDINTLERVEYNW